MYIYNDDDVYRKAGISAERTNAVYARVSTAKQKKDLDNQVQSIIQYCNNNGIKIDKVFKDVASGMNFDRKQFRDMMNMVLDHKIDTIYITYKDRFSRISFDLFERLFMEYKCNMNGIKFQSHEESYTSKCDALALEPIGKHEEYLGRRVKRGLFRSSTGKVINADQNGALNILRKVVGDSEFTRIVDSGHSLCPVRHRTPFFRGAGSM